MYTLAPRSACSLLSSHHRLHPTPLPLLSRPTSKKAMPPTSAIVTNLPPRPPPSSIVEPVQRSPVLSPKVADPRQHRSGSAFPSSPPQRPPTPPRQPPSEKTENGSQKPEVNTHRFLGLILPSPFPSDSFLFFRPGVGDVDSSLPPPGSHSPSIWTRLTRSWS